MKQYEYQFISFQDEDARPANVQKKLNALGKEGWKVLWHNYEPRNGHSGWWLMREVVTAKEK